MNDDDDNGGGMGDSGIDRFDNRMM